jgi:hypothetical protein
MSAQVLDQILINGSSYPIYSSPLDVYLKQNGITLFSLNQQYSRGYVASWKIEGNNLWLIEFIGENILEQITYSMTDLFPDAIKGVFASWFTGNIRVPFGKQIGFTLSWTGAIYESETSIIVKDGVIVDSGLFNL